MSNTPASTEPLLNVENLRIYFQTRQEPLRVVDGVDFTIRAGTTLALVGESGCGKSVTALALAGLVPHPGYIADGSIRLNGQNLVGLPPNRLRAVRGAEIAYIFQEPASSLNPVFRIGDQIAEAIRLHRRECDTTAEIISLLQRVGIPDPDRCRRAYPHELSGGMQQRAMIAMALACHPKLLVADEPTTALDVTIQAQILDLLMDLRDELGMAILLITHNLGLVARVADDVCVMYAGKIVEHGPVDDVLMHPAHPYTQGLLAAIPRLQSKAKRMEGIPGVVPGPAEMPQGCRFHPRCPKAQDLCRQSDPGESSVSQTHGVKCHYWK